MTDDDKKFYAWLDGELTAAEASAMATAVSADPRLSALAAEHRSLHARLRIAFDPVAEAPVPVQLRRALDDPAEIIDLAQRRQWRVPLPARQWMAMAATLAVGMFIGGRVTHHTSPVELSSGTIVAASALDDALDSQLASAPSGDVRIGLTFRDQRGRICRSFTGRAASGLACRSGERWQIKGLLSRPEGQDADYRMATGPDAQLAALIDTAIEGEPFGAEEERKFRARGWK